MNNLRIIAFYLPQFHPIPENDQFWGNGFTEWRNVAKAKPLFKGHYQPHIPADLGFYDLRLPETRKAQADLAKKYGIYGFCYWHYWFGNGKTILERPFNEVLSSGKPDFPFCLGWANESWSGIWHGSPHKILIEQKYPGEQDYINHFMHLLPAFKDNRYIKIDDKPVFILYRYKNIPNIKLYIDLWQSLAIKEGLSGIYFICINSGEDISQLGLSGAIIQENILAEKKNTLTDRALKKVFGLSSRDIFNISRLKINVRQYEDYVKSSNNRILSAHQYPVVLPNWDNTPRSGSRGYILNNSTPDLFYNILLKAVNQLKERDSRNRILFIKSWNEWAEGNYLEPDLEFGLKYLEMVRNILDNTET